MQLTVRLAAAAFAVFFAVFFFGLVDLAVVVSPGEFRPVVALEAGWGALFTVAVAGAFARLAWRPRERIVPAAQLGLVAVALALACLLGDDRAPLPVAVVLALAAAALATAPGGRSGTLTLSPRWPLLALAVAGAPLWLVVAQLTLEQARAGTSNGDITWGIGHWPVQGAAALTIVGSALLAAVWRAGRRPLALTAGLVGAVVSAACLAYPDSDGAVLAAAWWVPALVWSLAVAVTGAWRPRS